MFAVELFMVGAWSPQDPSWPLVCYAWMWPCSVSAACIAWTGAAGSPSMVSCFLGYYCLGP